MTCYLLVSAPGCLTETGKRPPKKTVTIRIFGAAVGEIVLPDVNLRDNDIFLNLLTRSCSIRKALKKGRD